MDFASLPIAALPLPPSVASVPSDPSPAPRRDLPLEQRLTLNSTITAKVNYYDLAQTRRAPFDLRTALIWLCLCAHDNSVWWEPRSPEHQDGEDAPPLPLALNFAAWMRYIQDWQARTFDVREDQAVEALALRVWIGAHETICVPEEDTKKNGTAPRLTGVSSTSMSSAVEMRPGETTSSTACPSGPSMPSSMHGSAPTASLASAPPSPPAATERSTISSPPPVNSPFWVAELMTDTGSATAYASGAKDRSGYDGITTNIHAAVHFDLKEQAEDWIRTLGRPEVWAAREHLIC